MQNLNENAIKANKLVEKFLGATVGGKYPGLVHSRAVKVGGMDFCMALQHYGLGATEEVVAEGGRMYKRYVVLRELEEAGVVKVRPCRGGFTLRRPRDGEVGQKEPEAGSDPLGVL